MQHQTQITGRQLEPILQEAARAGINVGDVLRDLGHGALYDEDVRVTAALSLIDFFRIEGEVARQMDDLTAHLSERKLTYETGAFVTAQMNQSTTLGDALTNLAQYFNMMHGERYNTIRTTDRTITLIINDADFPYTMKDNPNMVHFVGECVLIKVQCLLDSFSAGLADAALRRVSLKRPLPANNPSHLEFWTAPISFGQAQYELCFDRDLAQSPMPTPRSIDLSSEGVFSRVIAYLEQKTPNNGHHSFKARTLDLIRNGMTQQDDVAHRLSISVATLRRRLEDEGTSFRDLINDHLMNEATSLLQKGYSVAQVSDALDYSDIRAFNRAFKRWKGETPAKYARRLSQLAEDA
ncbi:MAG: helix-turn-helix domain-containing protein [Henriciella sp.]